MLFVINQILNTMDRIRQTSIDVYNEIKSKGLLSQKRMEIYNIVYHNGPMTSAEAFKIINQDKPKSNVLNQSRARFTELRDMGCLVELGTKTCGVTGNTVIEWDVTDGLPKDLPKQKTKKQKIDEILDDITKLGNSESLSENEKERLREIYRKVNKL